MTAPYRLVPILAVLLAVWAGPAAAQTPSAPAEPPQAAPASGGVYVVTYFEVGAASAGKAAGLLRRYSSQTRKADGNTGFTALREHGRPGRFATVESWRDKAALDAHNAAAKALADQLQPFLVAPPDPRFCDALDVAPPAAGAPGDKGVVYVLTHVDVVPSGKDQTVAAVRQLAADSRKDDGDLIYDALQQDNRPNHLTLFEAWRDRAAHNAYVVADHTKDFRGKLSPFVGALYDERLYEAIRDGK